MTSKEVKDLAVKKIPSARQEYPEFKLLIAIITKYKIPTVSKLEDYLEKDIDRNEEKLAEQKKAGSTINRQRVLVSKKLDGLRQCQKLVRSYLM